MAGGPIVLDRLPHIGRVAAIATSIMYLGVLAACVYLWDSPGKFLVVGMSGFVGLLIRRMACDPVKGTAPRAET
jgi:hypothetical protein